MTDPSIPPPPPGYYAPAPVSPYAPAPTGARYNTLAIVAFVLVFIAGIGAVICGHIALSQLKRSGESGHGLALAAVILGYISLVLTILIVVGWFVFVFLFGTGSFDVAPGSFG